VSGIVTGDTDDDDATVFSGKRPFGCRFQTPCITSAQQREQQNPHQSNRAVVITTTQQRQMIDSGIDITALSKRKPEQQ
jgi:hypothetical protein